MKYFSTFSGIGGFELGIELAYVDSIKRSKERGGKTYQARNKDTGFFSPESESIIPTERPTREHIRHITYEGQPTCVGYSEIDKYATQIYQKHFPNHKAYGDITKIDPKNLPDFDLFVGGFPCQSFSIAGKRGGFDDTRGTMFFEIARIVGEKQPRLLLLENVKGLLSHDQGRTFGTIIRTLDELGYDLQWQVLNSKNHGVSQNRERVFIIGHLRGTARPQIFPFGESDQEPTGKTDKQGCANTLTGRSAGGQNRRGNYIKIRGGLQKNAAEMVNQSPALTEAMGMGGGHTPIVNSIRRLTPTECERLQGFPDGWTEGVSDTQRYKCLGNAVTVNVIKDICEKLP